MSIAKVARFIVAIGLVNAIVMPPPGATAGLTRAGAPTRDGAISVNIHTDKREYRVGDPILVSVVVRNETDERLSFVFQPACLAVAIHVRDAHGNLLPKGEDTCGGRISNRGYILAAHASQQLSVESETGPTIWANLSDYGYTSLQAGMFTLTAAPTLAVFEQDKPGPDNVFNTAQVPRSNTITIVVK